MPIKPWFNEFYPLPTKPWKNMTQVERNRESSRRFIEENKLCDNCKKLKLKRTYKHFNKGDELFFKSRVFSNGMKIFMLSKDGQNFSPQIAVYRSYFDYIDE